ncbi:MAG: hypothetical protein QXW60_02630 [Nitrososphaerota archaeon]
MLTEDQKCRVIEGDIERVASQGFGQLSGEGLTLWPEEALYLLEKGLLEITDQSGELLGFQEYLGRLSRMYPEIWQLFLIYRDIRSSGRVVKRGLGGRLAYRLYDRAKQETAKYYILPLPEGSTIKVEDLLKATRYASRKGKTMIVAVLERRGEVVYYICSDTNLSNL